MMICKYYPQDSHRISLAEAIALYRFRLIYTQIALREREREREERYPCTNKYQVLVKIHCHFLLVSFKK